MDLKEFVSRIPQFSKKNHPEKIKAFGWFLHTHRGTERFWAADIRKCYVDANFDQPADMNRFLASLTEQRPPELLKDTKGYRLTQHVRERFDSQLGQEETVIELQKTLADLPGKISDAGEQLFLKEVQVCYRHGAFRAAIVMIWNLAYDHLVRWVLDDPRRLAEFNARIPVRYPKKVGLTISGRNDFEELKEDETVEIVAGLSGFSGNLKKLLKEHLGRRNMYAHPSTLVVERPHVDYMITDLVNNVVLALKLK